MADKDFSTDMSRRDFLKASAVSAVLIGSGALAMSKGAWAAGSDEIKVGLIGCGGRGTGAAYDCMNSSQGVKIVALGDVFKDRLDGCYSNLTSNQDHKDKVGLSPERCFVGFDAYQKVIASGVDMVILATPPGFRPVHFRAAVDAGKHVFMEKPVAVDGPGVRMMLEAGESRPSGWAAARSAPTPPTGISSTTSPSSSSIRVESRF